MDPILTISNLNLSFVSAKNKKDSLYLFRDLSFTVPRENIMALVGGNGAGKSTLFNAISGLQQGFEGDIVFEGTPLAGKAPHQIARLGIGRLFQGARIYEEMSILDNMLLGSIQTESEQPFFTLFSFRKHQNREKELIDKAGSIFAELFDTKNDFWEHRLKQAGSLSYGQQRLLAMARLLMGDYTLYLLDEPTSGVHAQFIEPIAKMIHHMNSHNHKTVLLIEHNMQFVRQVAEHCIFMNNGCIIATGSPDIVLNSELIQQIYMGF